VAAAVRQPALFINMRTVDPADILQRANRILTSVAARDEMLLPVCVPALRHAFGTDRMLIALNENGTLAHALPEGRHHGPAAAPPNRHALVEGPGPMGQPPLVADVLEPGPQRARRIRSPGPGPPAPCTSAIAIGIHAPTGLRGIICMGARLSGRIYDWEDQRTLQLLANQLAVGLENTELYARLQDSAIYNDILLDHLVSGVIAAGHDQRITICNREAKRILGVEYGNDPATAHRPPPARPGPGLPAGLRHRPGPARPRTACCYTAAPRNHTRSASAPPCSAAIPAKPWACCWCSTTSPPCKKLEGQVRRTDRLASLGTLSAGMAHEIKNPLVTLKTFTQLLPERYDDPDFRTTFSNLVGEEVQTHRFASSISCCASPAPPNPA
jgi:hypothetical protein